MLKTKKLLGEKLSSIYAPSETESLISLILEHVTGYNRLQLHLNQTDQLPEPKIMQIMEIVNKLMAYKARTGNEAYFSIIGPVVEQLPAEFLDQVPELKILPE